MTVEQIRDYTALAKRKSDIIMRSGNWKPEYDAELNKIDANLKRMRKEMGI